MKSFKPQPTFSSLLALNFVLAAPALLLAGMKPGPGSFKFIDNDGNPDKPIRAWYFCPEHPTKSMPIVFVMHGVNRDGKRYRNDWQDYAEQYRFLLLCPEFDAKNYSTDAYQWGNMFDENHR